jgi:D-lactate dehydrogenase
MTHNAACAALGIGIAVPNKQTVAKLSKLGVKLIAMRCAGFDRVDLKACAEHGIKV